MRRARPRPPTSCRPATGAAYVCRDGALRRLPADQLLGRADRPRRRWPRPASSPPRAWTGPRHDLTAPDDRPPGGADESVGDLVRRRLGDEVLDRLVDPLVGGINAGDCDRLSLQVGGAAARRGPRSRPRRPQPRAGGGGDAGRRPSQTGRPVFLAPAGGMGRLVDALADAARRRPAVRPPPSSGLAPGRTAAGRSRRPTWSPTAVVVATPAVRRRPAAGAARTRRRATSWPASSTPRSPWWRWRCRATPSTASSTGRASSSPARPACSPRRARG